MPISASLDAATLKTLINLGCNGAFDKSSPTSLQESALAVVQKYFEAQARIEQREKQAEGGFVSTISSIASLLTEWNRRYDTRNETRRSLHPRSKAAHAATDGHFFPHASRLCLVELPDLGRRRTRARGGGALIGLLPLFAVLYCAVRLTSRGPFLYSQMRPGRGGELFKIWKIRTMAVGSDRDVTNAMAVQKNNPQVTRVGKILRELKIDELPQLWNVVCGQMELVGPRPIAAVLQEMLKRAKSQGSRLANDDSGRV